MKISQLFLALALDDNPRDVSLISPVAVVVVGVGAVEEEGDPDLEGTLHHNNIQMRGRTGVASRQKHVLALNLRTLEIGITDPRVIRECPVQGLFHD